MQEVAPSPNILNRICAVCNTAFYESPSRIKEGRGKFCSRQCYAKSKQWTPDDFWRRVKKTDACWLWIGTIEQGYGRIGGRANRISAHRASWILAYGKISDNLHVLHKCDVPNCVNPSHLFLGTTQINTADAVAKGRNAKGSRVGTSKLTEQQIKEIRDGYSKWHSQACISRRYGVSKTEIMRILLNHAWKHI